jgi:hypothetical protein
MSAKKATQKSAKRTTGKASKGFTAEERAAMRERAKEVKAAGRRGPRAGKAAGESDVLEKIAEMPEPDRAMAERLRDLIKASRAGPLAENLVRDARVCEGRRCRLLPKRGEVQEHVRDVRLQRQGEPRRRRHVADLFRAYRVDRGRRGTDRRAREEAVS